MSLGLPYEPLAMMFKAISRMHYSIRTGFGDSKTYISCETGKLFQGVFQGNGAGPARWLLGSLMIVLFMHRLGMVSELSSPISGMVFLIMGFMFVDDTYLVILGDEN